RVERPWSRGALALGRRGNPALVFRGPRPRPHRSECHGMELRTRLRHFDPRQRCHRRRSRTDASRDDARAAWPGGACPSPRGAQDLAQARPPAAPARPSGVAPPMTCLRRWSLVCALVGSGCHSGFAGEIPVARYPSASLESSETAIVFVAGITDSPQDIEAHRVVETLREAGSDAPLTVVHHAMSAYVFGRTTAPLQADVVEPAR